MAMLRFLSIGVVLLLLVDIHHYCSADTALETILDFLELHSKYCTTSKLCSIRNNGTLKGAPCCQTCSCEKECERDDTCCPDYFLHTAIDNVTFSDATSLRKNAQNINSTAILGIRNDFQIFENSDMYTCVDYRLMSGDIYFDTPKIKNAYEMVTVCPDHDSAHPSIKSLCGLSVKEYRKNMIDSNSFNLEELVSIFTPVTSLKTFRTYRNIYCLACIEDNISDNTYKSWTAFYTCGSFELKASVQKVNPYELFLSVLTRKTYLDCNIVMRPPKIIEHITPKMCTRYDYKTCPLGTDARLDLFCRSFNLPVKQDEGKSEFTIYKNIACYLCNQNKTFVETCRYTQGQFFENENYYEIALNFRTNAGLLSAYLRPKTSNVDTIGNESISESINKNSTNSPYRHEINTTGQRVVTSSKLENMKKLSSLYCNNNNKTYRCVDIMCPLYFYQSNGECIPTFTSFGGMYFSINLEIKPAQSQHLISVLPVMTYNLEAVAGSFFSNYSLDIWSSIEEEERKIILAIINIISSDPDFISTINRINFFLQNMTDIRFQIEQGVVDISFKLKTKYDYQYVGVDKIIIPGFQKIRLEAYKRETKYAMFLKESEILQTIGCYRIIIQTKYKDMVPENYERIAIRVENSTWFYQFISCLEDAIPLGFNMTDTYMFKGFAGKTLNQIGIIQQPTAIFITNQDNVSNDDTGHFEFIEDSASPSSFGVREGCLTVFAVVTFAVILLTIVMYKKRVSTSSIVEEDNIELEHGPKL